MADKIITVIKGIVKGADDKEWIELTDHEGKAHRVFQSLQRNDESWCHLETEVDMLKAKIDDGSIEGLTLKLTKEKKGQWWNVVAVEEIKDVFIKEAQKQVEDKQDEERKRSISTSYAVTLAAQGIVQPHTILSYAEVFYKYMNGEITVKDEEVFRALIGKYFQSKEQQKEE